MAKITCLKPRLLQSAAQQDRRGSTERGYNYKWQQARKRFLREHPLCECAECGAGTLLVTAATVVDHVIAHRGDQRLFWDESNWRAMSKQCHDKKREDEEGNYSSPLVAIRR